MTTAILVAFFTPAAACLPIPCTASAQAPTRQIFPVDSLLALVRSHSVYRDKIQWPTAELEVKRAVASATTDEGIGAAVVTLFARLGDVHSSLTYNGRGFSHYEGVDEATRQKVLPLLDRQRTQSGKITATLLEGRVGYVLVPTMNAWSPAQVDSFARQLDASVRSLASQRPTGWIIDLRLNGGGNLAPMLIGLHHLLGNTLVGGTLNADRHIVQEWVLRADGLAWRDGSGERLMSPFNLNSAPDTAVGVAVLIGPVTMSSGEAVAIAFKGRGNTRFFGEATAAGYTTVTNPITINAQVSINLAVGFMTDRARVPYQIQVIPHQFVSGPDNFDEPSRDATVSAASAWLNRGRP